MKHKYIFYFFKTETYNSTFIFFERVKDGKTFAKKDNVTTTTKNYIE